MVACLTFLRWESSALPFLGMLTSILARSTVMEEVMRHTKANPSCMTTAARSACCTTWKKLFNMRGILVKRLGRITLWFMYSKISHLTSNRCQIKWIRYDFFRHEFIGTGGNYNQYQKYNWNSIFLLNLYSLTLVGSQAFSTLSLDTESHSSLYRVNLRLGSRSTVW